MKRGDIEMARPRAIYASVPPNEQGIPRWDYSSGTIPVEYSMPFQYWPDLDWDGNVLDDSSPTEYGLEHPKYLWSDPVVKDPINGESHVFIRQWLAGQPGGTFDYQTIPANDLNVVIIHAADDQYGLALLVGGVEAGNVHSPLGANTNVPSQDYSWRNVKSYFYHLDLTKIAPGTQINLITEAINAPQIPHGVVESNPAMFTWVMFVYDHL
jgi:hypothetical protein